MPQEVFPVSCRRVVQGAAQPRNATYLAALVCAAGRIAQDAPPANVVACRASDVQLKLDDGARSADWNYFEGVLG
eukprot:CAMPEP_0204591508 /NCGR_PEP_ID=MMETSP0661-20131031/50405_1 /ASSEMBLY_ACC=CAM_ASM_000606 /TAXON_ID=109239 /ORGANISM="Alexandrium margalefi, Strain AMGDE01CS-322" /LENGTH=74 /DNA_ID=CAMNT_0051601641 /DNA_START=122 /DNA_END=343 /DNA_ORIENTATION=-